MSSSTMIPKKRIIIPLFLSISFAGFYFIVLQMALSGAPDRFLEAHMNSFVPLSVTPKRPNAVLDKLLTPLLSFFVAAFGEISRHSESYPITLDFVWSFGAAIQLPLIEAVRPGANWALTIPMFWGILYQRVSGGWILPIWLAFWMRSSSRVQGGQIKNVDAQSVLVGWWFGHTIPALVMLIPGMPPFRSAPIWIAFPILMSLAQRAYLLFARFVPVIRKRADASGYTATQLIFASSLLGSAIAHLHVVIIPGLIATIVPADMSTNAALLAKLKGLVMHLWAHFVPPSLAIPSPEATTAVNGVQHFVQFDVIIVFGAVWIAGIWDLMLRRKAEDVKEFTNNAWVSTVAALLLAGGVLLGPGTSTAALFMYREKLLEDGRKRRETNSAEEPASFRTVEKSKLSPRSQTFQLYT